MSWLGLLWKLATSQWWTGNQAAAMLNLVIFVLAVVIAVRIAYMSWQALARYVNGRLLMISAFDNGSGSDVGLGFSLLVKDALRRLSVASEDIRIDIASRWADPVTISSDLASAVPQGSIVSGLVQLLTLITPTRDRNLTGALHATSPHGVGVTASLEWRSGGIVDTVTIWQDELPISPRPAMPPPAGAAAPADMSAFYPFAFAVAVWTAQKLDPQAFIRLGTDSWESYVAFSAGDRAQRAGFFGAARDLYLKALALDPKNRPARFNLAVVELRLARGAPIRP